MAWGKRFLGRGGRVVVMIGDGELQEGQNWEAFAAAAHQRVGNLWAIVDRNELQSDRPTEEILALGDLEAKLRAFGWRVESCDGHDHEALAAAFAAMREEPDDRPKILVAHTIKGRGVSFMEHPRALRDGNGTYRWHAGAPDDEAFARAHEELLGRIRQVLPDVRLVPVPPLRESASLEGEPESGVGARRATSEYVAARVRRGGVRPGEAAGRGRSPRRRPRFGLPNPRRRARAALPIRRGRIAEQDMVSMAAGLARQGLVPIVNSFASFLASRANEQIYNQASEGTKVVYALHYAGLIPAGPGKSHQSIRDISLLAALPNVTIVQPTNGEETRSLVAWAVEDAVETVAIRLAIGPSPRRIEIPTELSFGRGAVLADGDGRRCSLTDR